MSPKKEKNRGQVIYSLRQRELRDAFKKQSEYKNYHEWVKNSSTAKEITKSWSRGGRSYNDYISASTSGANNNDRSIDDNLEPEPGPQQPEPEAESDTLFPDFNSEDFDAFVRGVLNSGVTEIGGKNLLSFMDSMEVSLDEQAMELGGHEADSGSKYGGSRQNNRGIGIIHRIPKGIGCNSTKLHFSKTFLMYSYGYSWPYFEVDKMSYQVTSLALIPVDFLPSYLTKTEFDNLPLGSRMTEVMCSVKVLGVRTAFDTGTTLTGIANSEHVAIGAYAQGLNVHTYGSNVNYNLDPAKPMVPIGATTMSGKNLHDKLYKGQAPMILGIPRSMSDYWALVRPKTTDTENANIGGHPRLDKLLHRFVITNATDQHLCTYHYKCKNAILKTQKKDIIPATANFSMEANTLNTTTTRRKIAVKNNIATMDNVPANNNLPEFEKLSTQFTENYIRQLETFAVNNIRTHIETPIAQPQLHVGIFPIPQISPATDTLNFQNTSLYLEVTFACEVEYNYNSTYCEHQIATNLENNFMCPDAPQYYDGRTAFGINFRRMGNVKKNKDKDGSLGKDVHEAFKKIRMK